MSDCKPDIIAGALFRNNIPVLNNSKKAPYKFNDGFSGGVIDDFEPILNELLRKQYQEIAIYREKVIAGFLSENNLSIQDFLESYVVEEKIDMGTPNNEFFHEDAVRMRILITIKKKERNAEQAE